MAPRHRYGNRPGWETVTRLLAALIVLLLIAYGVAWYFGYLRPPPADLGAPATPAFAPAGQAAGGG